MSITSGIWVSIDGPDGSGKSVTASSLSTSFPNALLVHEFSETDLGRSLTKAVVKDPRIFPWAPISEALSFLADYIYQCETTIITALKSNRLVVSDRGFLSKWAYQAAVLADSMDVMKAHALLDAVLTSVRAPDLTLLLDGDPELLRDRIVIRDGRCSDNRYQFILRCQKAFETAVGLYPLEVRRIVQSRGMSLSALSSRAEDIVQEFLNEIRLVE